MKNNSTISDLRNFIENYKFSIETEIRQDMKLAESTRESRKSGKYVHNVKVLAICALICFAPVVHYIILGSRLRKIIQSLFSMITF